MTENDIFRASSDLFVKSLGGRIGRPGQQIVHHEGSAHTLVFVLGGNADFTAAEQNLIVDGKKMVCIPAGIKACLQARDKPLDYLWISFGGEHALRYMELLGFTGGMEARPYFMHPQTMRQFLSKIRQPSWPEGAAQELWQTGRLYHLFSLLLQEAQGSGDAARLYSPRVYVSHAREYIEANFATVTVEGTAGFIGISRSSLNNMFHQVLGVSTRDYIMASRIDRARALLRETSQPVSEIARQVGYPDQMAFSKIFRQKTGVSPTDYRKEEDAGNE